MCIALSVGKNVEKKVQCFCHTFIKSIIEFLFLYEPTNFCMSQPINLMFKEHVKARLALLINTIMCKKIYIQYIVTVIYDLRSKYVKTYRCGKWAHFLKKRFKKYSYCIYCYLKEILTEPENIRDSTDYRTTWWSNIHVNFPAVL